MKIDPSKRTHAQNRFLRRLNNRDGIEESPIGPFGSMIPGPLTPVEIEHKARRRRRRLEKAQASAKVLPSKLASFKQELLRLEALDSDSKAAKGFPDKLLYVKCMISFFEKEILRCQRIISVLS